MSETITIRTEYKNLDILKACVERMNGKWLGHGSHKLFAETVQGYGFKLNKWSYPIVLTDSLDSLKYDDYNGSWGNVADLSLIHSDYIISQAEQTAMNNGLMCERVSTALKVLYPEGREVWIFPDGRIEANGFNGIGCHDACDLFAQALGQTTNISKKPEYNFAQLSQGLTDA